MTLAQYKNELTKWLAVRKARESATEHEVSEFNRLRRIMWGPNTLLDSRDALSKDLKIKIADLVMEGAV